jgi:hypothetical protein
MYSTSVKPSSAVLEEKLSIQMPPAACLADIVFRVLSWRAWLDLSDERGIWTKGSFGFSREKPEQVNCKQKERAEVFSAFMTIVAGRTKWTDTIPGRSKLNCT